MHGANRLASNSLLEGLVFARRIADDIAAALPEQATPVPATGSSWVLDPSARTPLQAAMTAGAGVLRSAPSLAAASVSLAGLSASRGTPNVEAWEATNLLTVAATLVAAATERRETRGCHWRDDFPAADDDWRGHLLAAVAPAGQIAHTFEEMA